MVLGDIGSSPGGHVRADEPASRSRRQDDASDRVPPRPPRAPSKRDGGSIQLGCSDSVLVRPRHCGGDIDPHKSFEYHPADSAAAERLWDALYLARASKSCQPVADLEDAAFRQCNSSPPS